MQVATWDIHEGTTYGYAEDGTELVAIEALQNAAKCAKWGEKYTPGRAWYAYEEDGNEIARGHAKDLRAAKKEATAALAEFHSEPRPASAMSSHEAPAPKAPAARYTRTQAAVEAVQIPKQDPDYSQFVQVMYWVAMHGYTAEVSADTPGLLYSLTGSNVKAEVQPGEWLVYDPDMRALAQFTPGEFAARFTPDTK